ncbi:MAG: NfeD family protein [Leptolyngbyaceae cyanobacterium]|mgnify:CR=1 FL=1
MTYWQEKHSHLRSFQNLIRQSWDAWLSTQSDPNSCRNSHSSPTDSYLNGVGTAAAEITPLKKGRIKLHGSWWFALSNSNVVIRPGQRVRITGRHHQILLIELSQYG